MKSELSPICSIGHDTTGRIWEQPWTVRLTLVVQGSFIATVGALCGIVYNYYPDRASVPRTYPGGLEAELGGPEAPRAAMTEADMRAIIEGDK